MIKKIWRGLSGTILFILAWWLAGLILQALFSTILDWFSVNIRWVLISLDLRILPKLPDPVSRIITMSGMGLIPLLLTTLIFITIYFFVFKKRREQFPQLIHLSAWVFIFDVALIILSFLSFLINQFFFSRLAAFPFGFGMIEFRFPKILWQVLMIPAQTVWDQQRGMLILVIVSLLVWFLSRRWFKKESANRYQFPLRMACGGLVGILFVFILSIALVSSINLFDTSEKPAYSIADLKPAGKDQGNSYWLLLALEEPAGVDISSPRVFSKYHALFAEKDAGRQSLDPVEKKDKLRFSGRFPQFDGDWVEGCLAGQKEIRDLQKENSVLLDRHRMIIRSARIEEFLLPDINDDMQEIISSARFKESLLPDKRKKVPYTYSYPRMTFMSTHRLSLGLDTLTALSGKWVQGVESILQGMEFAKSMADHSRKIESFIFNGMAHLRRSLNALASLLNRKECPPAIHELVFQRLSRLDLQRLDLKDVFVFRYLMREMQVRELERGYFPDIFFEILGRKPDSHLFQLAFQKNRTLGYFNEYFQIFIDHQAKPPFFWSDKDWSGYSFREKYDFGSCLVNLAGKYFFYFIESFSDLDHWINELNRTKIKYDLTRILAELHMKYDPNKSFPENLAGLESYHSIDPYSGRPYLINLDKKVIYSIGYNRKDDSGDEGEKFKEPLDIIVHCRIDKNKKFLLKE